MNTKQTLINHLIKTLAEQLRKIEQSEVIIKNGVEGASRERAEACRAASKTVADLYPLGVDYGQAFDKAEELNEAMAA